MSVGTRRRAPTRIHLTGAASIALRATLEHPRRPARVLAVFPLGLYLEVRSQVEPHVVAVVHGHASKPPNGVVVSGNGWPPASIGEEAAIGDGTVEIGDAVIRTRRWWDPGLILGAVGRDRLADSLEAGTRLVAAHSRRCGLAGHEAGESLAAACGAGDLARAVMAAERLVGLGPGLTPSGDDMISGLLMTLRVFGGACPGGLPAVKLADWLGAAVTYDARTRTTPISATMLHCAARGQGSPEVRAVLRGAAGLLPLEPAMRKLLLIGHTSGADLAWGILAGLRAVLRLSEGAR
ncbi:DUF2877 domain-containing protein [Rhizohabitans arisaemae]|uniref:DUF2877 domain-containing protein n=1 Tax=Rhizohabitans arisaemae TaxID=2720610 RepID=UPI0024B16E40|nr:DUF2877 domain-containing protein [Rhizohabitans arisaemae]